MPNTPSPQSILMNVAIAKSEKRKVRTWDIKSAFLKAPVKRELYVRVSSSIVKVLLSMDPETFQPHVLPDGTMWAKVLKALYGASKLWHNLVHDTLIKPLH